MFLSAPLSHFSGILSYANSTNPSTYNVIQPFIGGVQFVFAQSFGWFLYGLALSIIVICAFNGTAFDHPDDSVVSFAIPICFFAQVLISISIRWFTPVHSDNQINHHTEELVLPDKKDKKQMYKQFLRNDFNGQIERINV
eukprot:UN26248